MWTLPIYLLWNKIIDEISYMIVVQTFAFTAVSLHKQLLNVESIWEPSVILGEVIVMYSSMDCCTITKLDSYPLKKIPTTIWIRFLKAADRFPLAHGSNLAKSWVGGNDRHNRIVAKGKRRHLTGYYVVPLLETDPLPLIDMMWKWALHLKQWLFA